mmetsp:Transcript_53073/g.95152  ORF Transcript_53073/g.95152 Transcript_53073/m.95152 type:complete len:575 (+) Transcript_53073:100-1824(+)
MPRSNPSLAVFVYAYIFLFVGIYGGSDVMDMKLSLADECLDDEHEGCALVALQRHGRKTSQAEEMSRSDQPTPGTTSDYSRPANAPDLATSSFVPNEDCDSPPCSGQVHLLLGAPDEMVVSFASLPEAFTKPRVRFKKAGSRQDSEVAVGSTETYNLLYYWKDDLWAPRMAGGHGLSRGKVAELQSTNTWAFPGSPAWRYRTAANISTGLGWYKNPAENYNSPAIHTVILRDLEPGQKYTYQVDNDGREFTFKMPAEGSTAFPYKVGLVSDLGQTPVSNASIHMLKEMDPKPEVVLLAGDLSYADGYYDRWDSFGILFEQLGAEMPLLTCPGNHEQGTGEAYKSYNVRYPMPYLESDSIDKNYWSRTTGPMHVISLNSYASSESNSFQYRWLERQLLQFSRVKTPWLVVMMHVPFYSSNNAHAGEGQPNQKNLEDLFYKYGVNIVLAGHVHAYERSWPVYQNKTDTCGTTYLTLGDGGNREGPAAEWLPGVEDEYAPIWSAFRQSSFGVGSLTFENASHARLAWNRNACFDNGEIELDYENCETIANGVKDNSLHSEPTDVAWIVRPTECQNQS